jgi:hypothetical protein
MAEIPETDEQRRRRERVEQQQRQDAATAWLRNQPAAVQKRIQNHLKLDYREGRRLSRNMERYGMAIEGRGARQQERISYRLEVLADELREAIAAADPALPNGSDANEAMSEALRGWAFKVHFR